jgi:hypothetical protein
MISSSTSTNLSVFREIHFETQSVPHDLVLCSKSYVWMYGWLSGRSRKTCVVFRSCRSYEAVLVNEPVLWPPQYHCMSNWSCTEPSMTRKLMVRVSLRLRVSSWEIYSPTYSVRNVPPTMSCRVKSPKPPRFDGPTRRFGNIELTPRPRYLIWVRASWPYPLISNQLGSHVPCWLVISTVVTYLVSNIFI